MITQEQLDVLADVFAETEALEKISITLDQTSRRVIITYDDLDDEWFRELTEAAEKRSTTR